MVLLKEITVDAKIENIPVVTGMVSEILEANDCPIKIQMQMDLVVDEIMANISSYAYTGKENGGYATIRAEINENPRAVVLTFTDNGIEYNPLKKEDPDTTLSAEERQIGGLGIFIVKKTMDKIEYKYENNCNILTVYKYY